MAHGERLQRIRAVFLLLVVVVGLGLLLTRCPRSWWPSCQWCSPRSRCT
jgi:hypothetical protein